MDLDSRLRGTRGGHILEELLTNSIHFPLANIILEMLLEGPLHYVAQPDLYAIVAAGCVQAWLAGSWRFAGRPRPLLGNLIAPALYTVAEAAVEGLHFFDSPHHIAFWVFALAIGLLQWAQLHTGGVTQRALLVGEHLVRTCILLAMYAFFEGLTDPKNATLAGFMADSSHQFVAIVIPLLGLVVGFAHVAGNTYLHMLQETAAVLRRYSSWLLGAQLLSQAVADPKALQLQRRERSVLFMDIRGFTAWSEHNRAEDVVQMLNGYFAAAERVLAGEAVVKAQFIGDEVMCVLADAAAAVRCARNLSAALRDFLAGFGLSAGIGVHCGSVIEGMIGASETRSYTVVGDPVNTAKRVCDSAAGGEVLLAESVREALGAELSLGEPRALTLKGKREPLTVHPLLG